jgi:hypothetical protein
LSDITNVQRVDTESNDDCSIQKVDSYIDSNSQLSIKRVESVGGESESEDNQTPKQHLYSKYGKGTSIASGYSKHKKSTKQITHEPIFEGSEIDIDNSLMNSQRNTQKTDSNSGSPQ